MATTATTATDEVVVRELAVSRPHVHLLTFILVALATVLTAVGLVRIRRPSPVSAGSGYGTGYGVETMMFGANPRKGAAR